MKELMVLCFVLVSAVNGQSLFDFVNKVEKPTTQCQKQMNRYIDGLRADENWAFSMLDASSKLNPGILRGQMKDVGHFDECIRLELHDKEVGPIIGKHCTYGLEVSTGNDFDLADLPLGTGPYYVPHLLARNETSKIGDESLIMYLSICIPDACYPSDVQEYFPDIDMGMNISYEDHKCLTKITWAGLDGLDITVLILFGVIVLIVISSTVYDVKLRKDKKENHGYLLAFSLLKNAEKLLSTERKADTITCLDGIRVLCILWIILFHRMYIQIVTALTGTLDIWDWMHQWYAFYFTAGMSSVDSFFFIGGVVLSYCFLRTMNKPEMKFNLFLFYLHRYLRLTPAMIMIVLFQISLARHLGNGPLYVEHIKPMIESCSKWWWSVLLYTQNYTNPEDICLNQLWYISMDMQLFVLSPLILIPLWKWRKCALYGIGLLICVSMIVPFAVIYYRNIRLDIYGVKDFYIEYYFPTHTRATPWLIGIVFGSLLYEYKDRSVNVHWMICITAWIATVLGLLCSCYYSNLIRMDFDTLNTAFFLVFSKAAWAIGMAWIVFACSKGYGGFVNSFLSLPLFHILAKLTYSMYLVHVTVIKQSLATARNPVYWSDFNEISSACSDTVITIVVSFFWVLLFEAPVAVIQEQLFKNKQKYNMHLKKQEII